MVKSTRSRAEERFTATQKKNEQALKERERARKERAANTARLRALRLAREAGDAKKSDGGE